ncbi:Bardet-Biedl syndrome 12 protein isoform X1 [Crotalus tigris]|uniref:Bardet-Biedl syndrome 12 protein isoform X1 n=2 Tax=Crotalus tigris TaxID=88082 RepID=UPI00192F60F4|nr:Bardet-Biedl syndrome 12 protein isoform X1 [Crotalus tigris]XP_039176120.1 Bardet-Biedl syndrome 12 protein isoform X1 [Crotalus tigris]XP_039176121.1 Bardet-Biedl syndrome 12 protein isoform X1 [Crotalus tigris]
MAPPLQRGKIRAFMEEGLVVSWVQGADSNIHKKLKLNSFPGNMAFRNVNRKRHIGLQQLSALASTGRTLLGPMKLSKFIIDENIPGGVLISSPLRLLENMDLNSAVGQLLNEAIQAQNKDYKTGMTTLLFLVGAWSNAVLECLQHDVPLSLIVAIMSEGLDSCIEQVQSITLSLHNIQQKLKDIPIECDDLSLINSSCSPSGRQFTDIKITGSKYGTSILNLLKNELSEEKSEDHMIEQTNDINPGTPIINSTKCLLSESMSSNFVFSVCKTMIQKNSDLHNCHLDVLTYNTRSKLTHSRYFSYVNKCPSAQRTIHLDGCPKPFDKFSCLGQLAFSLSHGNESATKLIQDILRCQLPGANQKTDTCPFQFNISEIVTCSLSGISESHSCVYPGFITLVCPAKAASMKQFQDMPIRVILIDGDLTETCHHLGFNRLENMSIFSENMSHSKESSSLWVDSVIDLLIQSNINLILVHGDTCEILEEKCLLHKIVIINHVDHNVLIAFSNIMRAEIVTYISQVNEDCIVKGICVNLYGTLELNLVEVNGQIPLALTAEGFRLVTVVLCCPFMSKMQAMEDQFWTCAYRLHHALLDQAVFPGGGAVELLCLGFLEKLEKTIQNSTSQLHFASSWFTKSSEQYKSLVLSVLASGWRQYLFAVMGNIANCTSEFETSTVIQQHLRRAAMFGSPSAYILEEFRKGKIGVTLKVCDNITAKIEAWRRALQLVLLVLQTDAEIIAGPKKDELLKSQDSGDFLFL